MCSPSAYPSTLWLPGGTQTDRWSTRLRYGFIGIPRDHHSLPLAASIASLFPVWNEGLPWTIQHNSYALLRPGNGYVETRCGARIKRLASLQKG